MIEIKVQSSERLTGLRGYRHKQANNLAIARHKEKNKDIKIPAPYIGRTELKTSNSNEKLL